MKRQNIWFSTVFFSCFQFLSSCDDLNRTSDFVPCPAEIAKRALEYALEYSHNDTEYEWGGQEPLRSIRIDCSGLIVNCYNYAIAETMFSLPFYDAAVINFYKEWSVPTNNPRSGDLIFMGEDKNNPSHMSLFVKTEGGNIYFVDSTLKPEDGINGVSERNYPKSDKRFLSFGVLLLCKQ
jgi:hypothetical protein